MHCNLGQTLWDEITLYGRLHHTEVLDICLTLKYSQCQGYVVFFHWNKCKFLYYCQSYNMHYIVAISFMPCVAWSSYGSNYTHCCLLCCDAMYTCIYQHLGWICWLRSHPKKNSIFIYATLFLKMLYHSWGHTVTYN